MDAKTQLICSEGRYIESPCGGPEGCVQLERSVKCDFSKNPVDAPCSTADEGAAACRDSEALVSCRGGKYIHTPCRGPEGCQTSGDQAECDRSIANPGEPCSGEIQACDKAGTRVLACQAGTLKPLYFCRGPDGCEVSDKVNCDLTIARQGDPCAMTMEGAVACGVDARALLGCQGGKFVLKERCADAQRCDPANGMRCAKP